MPSSDAPRNSIGLLIGGGGIEGEAPSAIELFKSLVGGAPNEKLASPTLKEEASPADVGGVEAKLGYS